MHNVEVDKVHVRFLAKKWIPRKFPAIVLYCFVYILDL